MVSSSCHYFLQFGFSYFFYGFLAFKLLLSGRDGINYLMVREAKIVAMTCTHAALKRGDMVQLRFKVLYMYVRIIICMYVYVYVYTY